MLLSRRSSSDTTAHHQVFVDTRSTWVGKWPKGLPVAVMYMGGGNGKPSVWAHTKPFPVGDWLQLTFTVQAGVICPYINGVRSGTCSAAQPPQRRQLNTGEPLEVGGEDSYSSHPLWNLASVLYYDRHLSEQEVAFNWRASLCLEQGVCN